MTRSTEEWFGRTEDAAIPQRVRLRVWQRDDGRCQCGCNRKIAAFLRPADEYAIISVHGIVVVEWKAKSQSKKAMGGPTFQKSKQDVMDFVSDMLRIETRERSAA